MHVLVTADTVGGVWTYAKELITGLVRRGIKVTLVSFGNIPSQSQTDWIEALGAAVDYRPTAFRLEWMQESEEDLAESRKFLMAVIDETKPDLLHLNQYCYGDLAVGIPKLVVAHSDVVSWWVAVKNDEPSGISWISRYRDIVSNGLAGATMVIAPSKWMMEQIEEWYLVPSASKVVFNGRTQNTFNPHITKDDYILSVGRVWDGGKQVSLLATIAPPAPVFVVGTEEHADAALRGGQVFGEPGCNLHLKGPQTESQLRHWYGRAAIYAATSRYEPFGLAPLEAAFSRCAIVANDISSFRELWGDTVCYFKANDPESLQFELECLHNNRELRLTFANLAYNRARLRYTAERMVEEYTRVYESLIGKEVVAA